MAEPLDGGMTVQTGADNPTKQVLLFVPESV